jgi:carboxypeptidase C (cathepsin A)
MTIDRVAAVALAVAATALPASAQTAPPTAPVTAAVPTPPRIFVSDGKGIFGGTPLTYRASVEEFVVAGAGAAPGASIFATSYVRTGKSASAERPVLFAFNGGPGSSSIWLHMGYLGPRRVDMDDPAAPQTTAPFHTVANPDSPLDAADIVLIDPPGTGWSNVLPGAKVEQFYGVQQDALATVQVIQDWLRRHGRLNSPKYLISESYGTVRAAAVAKLLAGGPTQTGDMTGITLDGVILLGQAMNLYGMGGGDDRAALDLLPTLAAIACYHGKAPAGCTPEGQAEAARRFIRDTYLRALDAGGALPVEERKAVAGELSRLTGLPLATVLDADLRISAATFSRALLESDARRLGAYDARFTLPTAGAGNDPVADDPAMGQYVPGFVAAWDGYARDTLGVRIDAAYQAIAFRAVNGRWDYGFGPGVPAGRNFALDLAAAMTRNPNMRLMVGAGYYDLVTPLGSAEYTVTHAGIPLARTGFRYYRSGHMPYLGAAARAALTRDVRAFLQPSR